MNFLSRGIAQFWANLFFGAPMLAVTRGIFFRNKIGNYIKTQYYASFVMRKLSQNCRIIFLSTTLTAGMTGISLHMQRPLTSQSHGSILKENNFLLWVKLHALLWNLSAQLKLSILCGKYQYNYDC
jgi:hypothetical protein